MQATGLEKTVGHRTLTNSELILSIGNFIPSDTDDELQEKNRKGENDFFLIFSYVKKLIMKFFTFTKPLSQTTFHKLFNTVVIWMPADFLKIRDSGTGGLL